MLLKRREIHMEDVIERVDLMELENIDLKVANLSMQLELLKKAKEEKTEALVTKYGLSPQDQVDTSGKIIRATRE
jgi:hypothetical protein